MTGTAVPATIARTVRAPHRLRIPPRAFAGIALLGAIAFVAIAAPLLSPYDPESYTLTEILQPPSAAHPFGTDEIGRDVLSRTIWGGRPVLVITLGATLLSLAIGVALGLIAATHRAVGAVIARIADIQLSIPGLVFALLAVALLGTNVLNIVVVLALAAWPLHYRVVSAHARTVRSLPYYEASVLARTSAWYRSTRIILPGVLPIVAVTGGVAATVIALSATGLSYLGLGLVVPDWGRMIATSKGHLSDGLWASGFPALALVLFLLALQLIVGASSNHDPGRFRDPGRAPVPGTEASHDD